MAGMVTAVKKNQGTSVYTAPEKMLVFIVEIIAVTYCTAEVG